MNKKLRKNLIIFFGVILLATALVVLMPSRALAQAQPWEDRSSMCVGGPDNDVATIQGFMCLLANIVSVALAAIGITGFVMMIVAAITWMLSGGDSQNTQKAGKTFLFAVVGLLVALSSYMIINIIAQFTGINVITRFTITPSNTGLPGGPQWDDFVDKSTP